MGRHHYNGHHKRSRRRKDGKLAALRRESRETNLTEEEILAEEERARKKSQGRGDSGRLLTDPHALKSDLKLLQSAVRKGWNVRRKTALRRRLEEIAMKKEAEVIVGSKEGPVVLKSETEADRIAIQALKALVAMDAQDLSRVNATKQPIIPPQTTTVNVNVAVDNRRVELARLAQRLGARALVIDGRSVPVAELAGPAVPASEDAANDADVG